VASPTRSSPALANAGQAIVGAAGSAASRSRAFAQRHGCRRSYHAPHELLADPEIDAVWVASPNHLHAEQIAAALDQGKHVLAEKPLATTGEAAHELVERAERVGRKLAVGYQARFHRANRDLATLVWRGDLGEIGYVRASWQIQYPGLPGEWRLRRETSGGWSIMDIGTHTLDAALWVTGFPDTQLLAARLSTVHWPVEVDDLAVLVLRLGQATAVVETATGLQGPPNRIEVHGTKGWAMVVGAFAPRLGSPGGRLTTSAGLDRAYDDAPNPYEEQARAFAAWTAGAEFAGATGAEGAINVALLQAAREWGGSRAEQSLGDTSEGAAV
jgi:1,5-anhydro-D-fructose reductase (1,5-anhydro-D-mannitol-forming)